MTTIRDGVVYDDFGKPIRGLTTIGNARHHWTSNEDDPEVVDLEFVNAKVQAWLDAGGPIPAAYPMLGAHQFVRPQWLLESLPVGCTLVYQEFNQYLYGWFVVMIGHCAEMNPWFPTYSWFERVCYIADDYVPFAEPKIQSVQQKPFYRALYKQRAPRDW